MAVERDLEEEIAAVRKENAQLKNELRFSELISGRQVDNAIILN